MVQPRPLQEREIIAADHLPAAELLREEIEVLGAVRVREVEKAQQEIVAIARKLEEEGLLSTGAAAGEAYVV